MSFLMPVGALDTECCVTKFAFLRLYTRREISDSLGGGIQDYLPHQEGRVVCACLSPDYNPDAPDVVLPGTGPDIIRWARVFAAQVEFVPVFVKRATNAWQYLGNYRVASCSSDPADVERWASVAGREGDLSMVLYLEKQ
jgi:hypothetical protein